MASNSDERAPLMIMTLFIPLEAKTLAPQSIKRDPRRQPIFCQNFKPPTPRSNDANNNQNNKHVPEIIIRGLDMVDGQRSSAQKSTDAAAEQTIEMPVIETNNNVGCCIDCMQQYECDNFLMPPMDKTELCLNFEGYEMDQYGHLPGDSRTPSPSLTLSDNVKDPCTGGGALWMRRACSPATGQVIRITMNDKNAKRRK